MSGRFSFNPNTTDIGFPVFPKGQFTFKIGEPKAFVRDGDESTGAKAKEGVSYLLRVVRSADHPDMVGKPYNASYDLSQDYGNQNFMQLLVAALGFKGDEAGVKAARAAVEGKNWDYNPADKTCGSGWHVIKEREVTLEFDTPAANPKAKDPTKPQNSFPTYLPAI